MNMIIRKYDYENLSTSIIYSLKSAKLHSIPPLPLHAVPTLFGEADLFNDSIPAKSIVLFNVI